MNILNLALPPRSQVVAERRRAETAAQMQRQVTDTAREIAHARRGARAYSAAQVARASSDWSGSSTRTEGKRYPHLRAPRSRRRDMARNNPHMKRFLGMVRRNVVGPGGIKLQVRAKKANELDELLNREVEEKFKEWCLPETCSASGKYSWVDAQGMAISTMARDGEFLCRFIEADNPFGFALQFYDAAFLDETYNEVLKNGNRILMSVEVNRYNRPVAYYFTTPRYELSAMPYQPVMERVRVPASEVVHSYLPFEDDAQVRGVPWAHAAMWELRILGQFVEAELISSHLSACKMGFMIPPKNDENAGIPLTAQEEEDAPLVSRAEPGAMEELPPGWDLKTLAPQA